MGSYTSVGDDGDHVALVVVGGCGGGGRVAVGVVSACTLKRHVS